MTSPSESQEQKHPRASGSTGRRGEDVAARYLVRQGCAIVARNWRAAPGEVDIVARCPAAAPVSQREQELLFVEVRTRHGRSGLAEESISGRKASNMAAAAYAYMAANNIDPNTAPWRIDLIAISMFGSTITSINWVKGAIGEETIEDDR